MLKETQTETAERPVAEGACDAYIHAMKTLAYFFAVSLTLLMTLSPAVAQQPSILWSFDTRDASFGQTAAGDIDGDGRLELVFGCYRNDSSIYALNAEDGSLLWKFNAARPGGDGCNDVAPLIVDTDGDGTMEVVVPSSCYNRTYCFDGATGAVRWMALTRGSDSPPTVADVDGDGRLEILHGEFGGWVRCLHADDGSLDWELAVDTRSWIQTAPMLLDVDGDGGMDFVVATWNSTEGDTNAVRAYRCSDRQLLWRHPLRDVVYHGTTVVDLDDDGRPELALGDYSGTVTVLNAEDGSLAWEMPSLGMGHYAGAPVGAGDLDGDGRCDLLAVSWYKVISLDRAGSVRWEYDIPDYQTSFRGAALADVSGDELPDAVFGTSGGLLEALSGLDGSLLWSVDLAAAYGDTRFELDHAPVIADLDGDGKLDAFIVGGHTEYPDYSGNFGRAYAISIGRGTGPEWRMFQRDPQRRSSLCGEDITGVSVLGDDRSLPLSLYPSPVSRYLTVEGQDIRGIRIVDAAGRIVRVVPVTGETTRFDLDGLRPGSYYLVATGDGTASVRAFVKL